MSSERMNYMKVVAFIIY